jgi:hypothetical protein
MLGIAFLFVPEWSRGAHCRRFRIKGNGADE